jgi:conjugal transfer pilus assembly protein TraE
MEFKSALAKLEVLSGRLHYMLLISLGLLISNLVLSYFVGWSFSHQERTIVPVSINAPFTVSDYKVDTSYLRQMALFFVSARLNLTPGSIESSQNTILQYTAPQFYHEFADILEQERKQVIKQNISAVFYTTEVIPDSEKLQVVISGTLSRWVGSLTLPPVKKNYLIKFAYNSGILKVLAFSEVGESSNVAN